MPQYCRYHGPLGGMLLVACDGALAGVYFADQRHLPPALEHWPENAAAAPLAQTARQLDAYFEGRRQHFDLPLAPSGTPYRRSVWAAISRVAYGCRSSYGEIAAQAGGSPRAAGTATGRNPLGIVVPCHRIVGADGSLTGYAGGLDRKRALLRLEAEHVDGALFAGRGTRRAVQA